MLLFQNLALLKCRQVRSMHLQRAQAIKGQAALQQITCTATAVARP